MLHVIMMMVVDSVWVERIADKLSVIEEKLNSITTLYS